MKKLLSALFGVALLATSPAQAAQVCGNGVVEAPETCDDGNTVDGDGCNNACGVVAVTPPSLAVSGGTAAEDAGPLGFQILRSHDTNNPVNVGLRTIQDTAFVGPDFTGIPAGTRTIVRSGQGIHDVGVALVDDLIAELDEQFTLEISNAYEAGGITMLVDPAQAAGATPAQMVVGDFNGDRKPDVVVGNFDAGTVSVLGNASTPGTIDFASPVTEPTGSSDPFAMAAADVDADGLLDVVVTNRSAGTVSVLRHVDAPGVADFEDDLVVPMGTFPYAVAVADLDGDGLPELVTADRSTDQLWIAPNATAGGTLAFGAAGDVATCDGPTGVAAGDLDGDGDADLVVACQGTGQLQLFINDLDTAGNFGLPVTVAAGAGIFSVLLADIDADGKPDVVTADRGVNAVAVFRNASVAGAPLSVEPRAAFAAGNGPHFVAAGDMDGDGLVDLVASNRDGDTVSVLRNTTPGGGPITFAGQVTYATGDSPFGLVLADFDGDAQADIATANSSSNTVSAIRNNRPVVAITQATATGTITDDDEVKIAFATDTGAANESAGTYTVTVTALGVSDEAIPVSYALSGTATSGTDYTISPSTLTFAPGDASKTLTISGLADAGTDGSATETIVITLQDPGNAGLNPPNPFTLTVTNDSNTPVVVTPPPSPTPTPTAPASSGGGALNLGWLALLGLGALARRRRIG